MVEITGNLQSNITDHPSEYSPYHKRSVSLIALPSLSDTVLYHPGFIDKQFYDDFVDFIASARYFQDSASIKVLCFYCFTAAQTVMVVITGDLHPNITDPASENPHDRKRSVSLIARPSLSDTVLYHPGFIDKQFYDGFADFIASARYFQDSATIKVLCFYCFTAGQSVMVVVTGDLQPKITDQPSAYSPERKRSVSLIAPPWLSDAGLYYPGFIDKQFSDGFADFIARFDSATIKALCCYCVTEEEEEAAAGANNPNHLAVNGEAEGENEAEGEGEVPDEVEDNLAEGGGGSGEEEDEVPNEEAHQVIPADVNSLESMSEVLIFLRAQVATLFFTDANRAMNLQRFVSLLDPRDAFEEDDSQRFREFVHRAIRRRYQVLYADAALLHNQYQHSIVWRLVFERVSAFNPIFRAQVRSTLDAELPALFFSFDSV